MSAIIYGGLYKTNTEKQHTTDGHTIEKNSIGHLKDIDENGDFILYFRKGHLPFIPMIQKYTKDELSFVPQTINI